MKALGYLITQLPRALLLSSLAFTAAGPVQSAELNVLTPENFKSSISRGVWFIEHFSPYCRHCRNFAPTWSQVVDHFQLLSDPGIQLAQVNCAVHGDLCRENGIDGYPQMNLYSEGTFVETFNENRDFDTLLSYLISHARPEQPAIAIPASTALASPQSSIVQIPETPLPIIDSAGTVTPLDSSSFQDVVKIGHVFVKFFAPWCGHCKKLAPVWVELAYEMRGKLNIAEVNCDEHSALCRSQGITGYPMLVYYSPSGEKTEYAGGRKLPQLKAFAEKVSVSSIQPLLVDDLDRLVSLNPVLYLLLSDADDARSYSLVREGSKVLFGTPPIYTSNAEDLYKRFSLEPSGAYLIALKDHDGDVPASFYQLLSSESIASERDSIKTWLLSNRLPTALELDSDTFQEVMNAPHKPFVVLAASQKDGINEVALTIREIAMKWKNSKNTGDVVFAWMDGEKWATWLKGMYGVKAAHLPAVILTNHSKLVYYEKDLYGDKIKLTSSSIFSAINGATSGTITYHHSQNVVERLAQYLNYKLEVFETVVSEHPYRIAMLAIGLLAALFYFVKWLLFDEDTSGSSMSFGRYEEAGCKLRRID